MVLKISLVFLVATLAFAVAAPSYSEENLCKMCNMITDSLQSTINDDSISLEVSSKLKLLFFFFLISLNLKYIFLECLRKFIIMSIL